MKKIVEYECEICRSRYNNAEDAIKCEDQSVITEEEFKKYQYVLFNNTDKDSFYPNITFCHCRLEPAGHYMTESLWAWRDNGAGDTYGEALCGTGFVADIAEQFKIKGPTNINAPHFLRAVKWLRENGYPVKYWDGNRIVDFVS